ncbi:hypothetical protein Lupro_09655 [Lutibacter profundi]|uniref:Uncharacterized protein n=1 Tax=Lutibacter profundi TaxID=1622118 RepID=A0A109RNZ7_9FLAO|nr:hypothetical protein [Lutibacter profundi]AMC11515.1 hypothetical protein Lupro_09655 [Lutibacter profundi]
MNTFAKLAYLRILGFAKLFIFLISISLSFSVKAQIGGSFTAETPTYDFTDFKPLTAAKFIENEFVFLKREYDKYPSTLEKGYRIEVIPSKRQGFRPSVSNHQIYRHLIDNAVLEWAHQNNYTVYLDNGYKIVNKLKDSTEVVVYVISAFTSPLFNKTIEQEFDKNHNSNWNNQTSGWSVVNTQFGTLHGLKSFETIRVAINGAKLIDECQKKLNQLTQSGNASKEKSIAIIKSFTNHYEASIELIRSRYGEVSGEIENRQKPVGVKGDLVPVKDMIDSMLTFCDHKIDVAKSLFLERNKSH